MPLDAVCLQAVVNELRPQLLGIRIDKVQQPARDQIILLLRGNRRLLLNAGANSPRIQMTERVRDNPAEPPMFCMLLRKHLVGSHVAALRQPRLERLVELELEITDEFGRPGKRSLILEAMGRHSNLILLDGDRRILDCLRRVDAEMSPQRQVLPGLYYELPPTHGKMYLTDITEDQFQSDLSGACPEDLLESFLLDRYFGISPLIARELIFRATGESDRHLCDIHGRQQILLWEQIDALKDIVKENRFTPICLKQNGRFKEFSYLAIRQYGTFLEQKRYDSFSTLMDDFYEAREQQERVRQRGQDLIRTATGARDRLKRKMALQQRDYAATQERDNLRLSGDLITANLYHMERGASTLIAENYYAPGGEMVAIPLDPLLTPQQNAAKYYKRYTKAKTAEKYLKKQLAIDQRDIAYLESVLEEIREAETEQDFSEIRSELREAGYLRKSGKMKRESKRASVPREFCTTGGFRVLVGRNNRQNDHLTLKAADYRDLWFHTQKIHGAHVILCTGGREPSPEDIAEAANIAAWYSQARESGKVPVDFTMIRNIKKPSGARPGMVLYSTYRTVHVTPDEELVKRLERQPRRLS
jgi:predicted ribosome quality control (RQC) complex YloA/Tae2 family protein